ncbi:MAG TPA: hypothetical protein PKE56_01455 [Acidimicrobiales bacterium]|nr:hypothetical protein [Acidimicrobiales bacterium]
METATVGRVNARVRASVPDRPWVPAVAGLVLAVLFLVALLVRAGGDVSLLVHAAPPWTDPAAARPSLTVQPAEDGFDGQFFYRLGVAPWSTDETVAGVTNDLPALRNARWAFGALAWVASAGDPDLVPWSLVGLNLVAAAALGAVGGGLARSSGRHAAWGLLFVLWPGFAYSLSLDTSELVATAFALGGLLALRHRRWLPAAALLAAAVLTRDTALVVPAGVAAGGLAWMLFARGGGSDGAADRPGDGLRTFAAGASGVVVFGAWQLVQRSRFGELPLTSSGDNNLSAPFAGLVDQVLATVPPSGVEDVFRLLCMAGVVALVTAAAVTQRARWGARRGNAAPDGATQADTARDAAQGDAALTPTRTGAAALGESAAWCLAVAVVVLLNAYLWSGATAFMRATTEAGVLSVLVLLGHRSRGADRLVAMAGIGLAPLWALTAVAQLTKLG